MAKWRQLLKSLKGSIGEGRVQERGEEGRKGTRRGLVQTERRRERQISGQVDTVTEVSERMYRRGNSTRSRSRRKKGSEKEITD